MRKLLTSMAGVIVFLLTLVATTNAANACTIIFYEPDLPKTLQE